MVTVAEIPKGYRKTEVGVIPEDWEVDSISQLASITTGSKNTQDKIDDGDFPFFVRSQTVERINSYSFDGEAVLTAGDGVGTGKIFHYIKGKFDFHQRVYKISEFKESLDGYFFYLYFSNHFLNRIMQMTAKSSVDSVRMEMIADMKIPHSSTKPEQKSIAIVLSDVDKLITNLDELLVKKRNVKQGTMQELLTGKKRLHGFSEEWKEKTLSDIALINMGQSPDSKYYNSKGIGMPLIQGNADLYKRKSIQRIWTTHITKVCDENDLILTVRAPVGAIGISSSKSCIGRGVCSLKAIGVNKIFLYHMMMYKEQDWKILEQGSTFTAANSDQIKKFELRIPESDVEQSAISQILSDMDVEIEELEQKLNKYRMIKQGMMQELLTGKTRLI